jgi:diaminohydroxyphosphoribosylaminopyrimidine deaminase/5-amino-6-(5-phosphoribosylamino)uracil reductase
MIAPYSPHDLMKIAVEQHLQSTEFPRVGAVIAKDGVILATGFRGEVAKTHAERVAFDKISPSAAAGAAIYTTLEPCVELKDDQPVASCADLIVERGIREAYIGVLDPNSSIYTQGYRKLLDNNVTVKFFSRTLRDGIEEGTFEYGVVDRITGSGKRRVPIVASGIEINVQFSEQDTRSIPIRWKTIQLTHGCVDLYSGNGAVRRALGARNFGDISDPTVFRFPSHHARMEVGDIAIVQPSGATFCVLIQLLEILENSIQFLREVRNVH